jgi:hypothetical protein
LPPSPPHRYRHLDRESTGWLNVELAGVSLRGNSNPPPCGTLAHPAGSLGRWPPEDGSDSCCRTGTSGSKSPAAAATFAHGMRTRDTLARRRLRRTMASPACARCGSTRNPSAG